MTDPQKLPTYFGIRNLGLIVLVALAYFGVAQTGYLVASENEKVTTLLSASGVGLAAILLLGKRISPGILIGAFFSNFFIYLKYADVSLATVILASSFISIGCLVQALVGNYLFSELVPGKNPFDKTTEVYRFTFITLFISFITALTTAATINLFKIKTNSDFYDTIISNWLSDITGLLIITPLLLGWTKTTAREYKNNYVFETVLLYSLVFCVSGFIFLNWFPGVIHFKKAYLTLPLLLWAAKKFEQREVVTAIAISSTVAILGTLKKLGPFSNEAIDDSFLSSQIYVSIVSITILSLRAATSERYESELELRKAHLELNSIAEERKTKLTTTLKEVEDYQRRIDSIFNVLLKYTVMNFSEKAPISERADEIDAISAGLNTLGEELQYSISAEKKYTENLENLNSLLQDSEQQIQTIFANAPEAVIVMDAEGIIDRWNPTAEEIFGWTSNEIIGKPFHEFVIPPHQREIYLKGIKHFLVGKKRHVLNTPIEIEVMNRNGNLFTIALNISPTLMKGRYLFIAFARDITEAKKAEEKLHYTSYMINNATDAIFASDKNLIITFWNNACEKLYGFDESEVIGKSYLEIIKSEHPETSSRESALKELNETGSWSGELYHFSKAGKRIPVLSSNSLLKDKTGKMIGYLSVVRDISEIKNAEKEIKRSQEFLNSVVENVPNMLFIKDARDLKFVGFNKAGEELLGFSRNDLIGKNDYDFFPKEEADFFTEKDKAVLRGGVLFEIPEEKIHTKNKGIRILETKKIPLFDEGGRPKYLLGISNDITDRIKMEEQLKEKSVELARSNTELEQFAYVASHDLQEPLRMVNSYVQLLSTRYKDKLDQDANDFIGYAVDGSNRMRNLINSLLAYSRINRVKPFEQVNLNKMMTEVLQDLKNRISENKATIKVDELPTVFGDHVLLSQLFTNLIGNAIKFKDERDPEITISYTKKNDEFLFSIKDNGIGIKKEYAEKIFVIFQRLHSKEKYPGTGIGLAICKKIVERHGGKIWIESEIEKGTTFYFTIKENLKSPV